MWAVAVRASVLVAGAAGKTIVMGLAERDGRMKAVVIPQRQRRTRSRDVVLANVEKGARRSRPMNCLQLRLTGRRRLQARARQSTVPKEYAFYGLPCWRNLPREHS